MKLPAVHVVIVNWNRWPDTLACVSSVMASEYHHITVWVVDNNSCEGDAAVLQATWPQVSILYNKANLGFAAAVNMGIQQALHAGADYIFTLNNDAVLAPSCVSELLTAAEADSRRGIIGPKIYYLDRPTHIWFAGANRHPWLLSLLDFGRGQPDGPRWQEAKAVTYLTAGAMLTRKEVFANIGLFDPHYFMYYEDCDFALKVVAAGYLLWYTPTAKVWHTVAASSGGEGSAMEIFYRTESVFRFIWQNSHGLHRLLLLCLRIGLIKVQMMRYLLQGQIDVVLALLRGTKQGIRQMRRR